MINLAYILVFCALLCPKAECSSPRKLSNIIRSPVWSQGISKIGCSQEDTFSPTYEKRLGTDVLWQIPDSPKAILYMAHGRFLDIFSFFDKSSNCELCYGLPEDRALVLEALNRRYAVIIVKSLYDEWISWPPEESEDKKVVTSILTSWRKEQALGSLPIVGFGYSSGGNFTSMLSQYLDMKSIVILDSPGVYEVLEEADVNFPPTLYFYMPKDPFFTSQVLRNAKMMKAQGANVSLVPVYDFPLTPHLFAMRIPCISNKTSEMIFKALITSGLLGKDFRVLNSPWVYDYTTWLRTYSFLPLCGVNLCWSKHVVQELNVAYAFHSMYSLGKSTMFDWFDSSLSLQENSNSTSIR